MDYGQNIVLSIGTFLCSAPSVNSTMDFSKKRVEDGVVDSPVEKKVKVVVVYSHSSLHAKERIKAATLSVSDVVRLMQRKVYEDANYGTIVTEVPATCLNDRHDLGGHAASSTSLGKRKNVLSTVQVLKRKRDV